MLRIVCLRHGQSTANAGAVTSDPASIPLSEIGHEQAMARAELLEQAPDLCVVSPFLRARQTADALSKRFPSLPVEAWPIQEFTYLSTVRSAGTTPAQRRPRVLAYWERLNVDFDDGEGAESFASFMERVKAAKAGLEGLPARGIHSVVCVGHGQFWQALMAVVQGSIGTVDASAMRRFKQLEETQAIGNVDGFRAVWNGESWGAIARS